MEAVVFTLFYETIGNWELLCNNTMLLFKTPVYAPRAPKLSDNSVCVNRYIRATKDINAH